MLSVKTREAADINFKVFGMTQLRVQPSLPCFEGERSKMCRTESKLVIAFYQSYHF